MMHINSLISKLNLKDPWSAITHGIAMLLAIAGTAPLLLRAASGENAAWGSVSPEEVVTAWMNSEGHRANILDPEARAMGVGYYYNSSSTWGHQWIQLFTK